MSKTFSVQRVVFSAVLIAAGVLPSSFVIAADANVATHMDVFSAPNGTNYFALGLKPNTATPAAQHDVVVLVNTSASQAGDYRAKAIEALKGFLAALPTGDKVHLIAVDLTAVPLTRTFVAPSSKDMTEALAALDQRTPLGATDMGKAIDSISQAFAGVPSGARAAVYIGDGRSRANLLGTEEFQKLTSQLADSRIPVSS
jgi:hypothetical protein